MDESPPQPLPRPDQVRFAGLAVRGVARVIDGGLFLLPAAPLSNLARSRDLGPRAQLALAAGIALLWVLCQIYMHAWFGQTFGKMLLRIRVVGADGRRIPLRQSVRRSIVEVIVLSAAAAQTGFGLLGVGFPSEPVRLAASGWFVADVLAVVVRRDCRALHDLVGGTRVVHCATGPRAAATVMPTTSAAPRHTSASNPPSRTTTGSPTL